MNNAIRGAVILSAAFLAGFLLASTFPPKNPKSPFDDVPVRNFDRPAIEDVGKRLAALSPAESEELSTRLADLFPPVNAVAAVRHARGNVDSLEAILRRLTLHEAESLGVYLDGRHGGTGREFAAYVAKRQWTARKKIHEIQNRLTAIEGAWISRPLGRTQDEFPWLSKAIGRNIREIVGLSFVREYEDLGVYEPVDISDDDMRYVVALTGLKRLYLERSHITDAAMTAISCLEMLDDLDVSRTNITDSGLAELAGMPRLRRLKANSTKIDGSGLAALSGCPRLTVLDILDIDLSNEGMASVNRLSHLLVLSIDCHHTRELNLHDLQRLTKLLATLNRDHNDEATVVLKDLPLLEEISLELYQLAINRFEFEDLPRAKTLWCSSTQLDRQQFEQIGRLASLKRLSLSGTGDKKGSLDASHIRPLVKLSQLEELDVRRPIVNETLPFLGELSSLKKLTIVGDGLTTDDCERSLSRLKQLEELTLSGITGENIGPEFLGELSKLKALSLSDSALNSVELSLHPTLRQFGGSHNVIRRVYLENMPNLQHLDQTGFQGSEVVVRDLPMLKWLSLSLIRADQIERIELRNLPRLRYLHLIPITPHGSIEDIPYTANYGNDVLEMASEFKALEDLDMPRSAVTEAGLKHLEGMPRLQTIGISGPRVSYEAVKSLRASQYEMIHREAKARADARRAEHAAHTVGSQPGS